MKVGGETQSATASQEELNEAKVYCSRKQDIEDKLGKYYDNESKSTYFLQGPCKYDGNKNGIKLLSKGNICLPIEKAEKKIEGSKISEPFLKTTSTI